MPSKESSPFQVFMKLNVKIFEGLRRVRRAEEGEEAEEGGGFSLQALTFSHVILTMHWL